MPSPDGGVLYLEELRQLIIPLTIIPQTLAEDDDPLDVFRFGVRTYCCSELPQDGHHRAPVAER
jgi:hypothetical protein